MEFKKLFKASLLCGAGAIALGGTVASAQIDEIIVTAQKREQSLNDVPVAVTAFTGADMEQLGFSQPINLAGQTPGLSIGNTLGASNPAITVRGVGINDFNTNTNPGVAVYVDGIYQPIPATLSFGLFDMERVEVLKGPQGTLYGRNATGGAVSFITKRPGDELDGFATADVGSFGYTNIEAGIGGPITERVSGRLSGFRAKQTEGFQTVIVPDGSFQVPGNGKAVGDHGKIDRSAVRAQLAIDLADNFDALFSYTYGVDKSDSDLATMTDSGLAVSQAYFYTYWGGPTCYNCVLMDDASNPPTVDMQSNSWNLEANWDLGFATLTSVTGKMDVEHVINNDFTSTEFPVQTIAYGGKVEQISEELRLTSNEGETIDWILGFYYSKTEQDNASSIDMTFGAFAYYASLYGLHTFGAPFGFETRYEQEQESLGVFLHTEMHVNEQLRLTVAARLSRDTLDYDAGVYDETPVTIPFVPGPDTGSDQPGADIWNLFLGPDPETGWRTNGIVAENAESNNREEEVTWKLGVDYDWTDNTMVYASVANGFKNQGFYGGLGPMSSQYKAYLPEKIFSAEVGFKSTLADGRAQVNGAVYQYQLEDPQVIVSEFIGLPGIPNDVMWNIGEAEGYGAELDLTWLPTDKLTIRAGLSYLNSEVTDPTVTGKAIEPQFALVKGSQMSYAPEWTYNAVIRYDTTIRGDKGAFWQVDLDSRDDANSLAGRPNTANESRLLVNGRVGITAPDGQWELAIWGKNLTDEEYAGFTYYIPGKMEMHQPPRTYGLSVTFNIQ